MSSTPAIAPAIRIVFSARDFAKTLSGLICRGVPPWAPALLPATWEERAPPEGRPYKLGRYPKSFRFGFQLGELITKLRQILVGRFDFCEFVDLFFSALRVAFLQQHEGQSVDNHDVVRFFERGRAIPFFGRVIMCGVHVYHSQPGQYFNVLRLHFISRE